MCYTIGSGDAGRVLKVGDGTLRWDQLPYLMATGSSGPPGPSGIDGHSITVYGPSASPPAPANTQLFKGDIWLADGIYARNPSFDASLVTPGAKGDKGDAATIDSVSAVRLPNGSVPTAVNNGDTHNAQIVFGIPEGDVGPQGIPGIQGPPGPKGPAGDTFKISGAVADASGLPAAPPNLSVYITKDNSHLHIYDPTSAAASANGYVDLGAIAGPQGASTYFSAPVANSANLPAVGAAGQAVLSLDDGHMHSWDVTAGSWTDAGQIRGPSGAGISDGSADGQVPIWSVLFHAWSPTALKLNTVTDVEASQQEDGTALEDADILHYDLASQTWKAISIRDYLEAEVELANIGDCTVSGGSTPTDGQVLTWDNAGLTWHNADLPPSGIPDWSDQDWKAGSVVYAHSPIGNDHRLRLFRARQDIATGSLKPMDGQPQVDVVKLIAPTQTGLVYTVGTGGSVATYMSKAGDSVTDVRDALVKLINGHTYMGHAHAFPEGADSFRLFGETNETFTTFLPPDIPHGPFVTGFVTTRQPAASSFWEDISPQWHLEDLEGIDIRHVRPTEGQVLVWADARGEFEAGDFTIDALSNTEITAPQDGQSLVWNATSSKWVNAAITSPIVFMGTGAWNAADVADPARRYGMAADTAPSPADYPPLAGDQYIDLTTGTVTVFTSSAGGSRPTTRSSASIDGGNQPGLDLIIDTLDGLNDVDLTGKADGAILGYDATTTKWVPMVVSTPITYYGEGALDPATATTAPRYGTPANTVPDVTAYPPNPGDTYINVLTGEISHWLGSGGNAYSDQPRNTPVDTFNVLTGTSPAPPDFQAVSGGATKLSGLTDVSTAAPATGNLLLWNGSQWAPSGDYYNKSQVDAKFTLHRDNVLRTTPVAGPLYASHPSGASSFAKIEGFIQSEISNSTIQPYLYFADGHSMNFAVTTNKAHGFHFVQYDTGGTRDQNDTFVTNHQCRWTFKSVTSYDLLKSRPLFFTFAAYEIDGYWELTWHGTYLSANNTPMIYDGGIEYYHNSSITRMGVRALGFNNDTELACKGRIIFKGE